MGAALCSCGGRTDDYTGLHGRTLRNTSRQSTTGRYYGNTTFPPFAKDLKRPHLHSSSHRHSRGETNELSDDVCYADGEDDEMLANRQSNAMAIADAFRLKLQEPPMSPRSKLQMVAARLDSAYLFTDSDESSTSDELNDDDLRNEYNDTPQPVNGQRNTKKRTKLSPQQHMGSYSVISDDNESLTEEDWKLRANPFISIIVPPGPCGLVLQVENEPGMPPTVDGFVRKSNGTKCTIENSGLIVKGSLLYAINDIDVARMPVRDVIRILNLSSHLEREFIFRNPSKFEKQNSKREA